jgi:hypothetical protein
MLSDREQLADLMVSDCYGENHEIRIANLIRKRQLIRNATLHVQQVRDSQSPAVGGLPAETKRNTSEKVPVSKTGVPRSAE